MLDYHVILDLIPDLATAYFTGQLKSDIKLTGIQQSILLAVGLQCKDLSSIEQELNLPSSQLLAMFIKIMRKMSSHFGALVSGAHEANMPRREDIGVSRADASGALFVPLETGLEEELEEGGDEALRVLREKQRELIDALPLDQ
jgi:N-acetyltransferase 10